MAAFRLEQVTPHRIEAAFLEVQRVAVAAAMISATVTTVLAGAHLA
jgi:hypothetical protein